MAYTFFTDIYLSRIQIFGPHGQRWTGQLLNYKIVIIDSSKIHKYVRL